MFKSLYPASDFLDHSFIDFALELEASSCAWKLCELWAAEHWSFVCCVLGGGSYELCACELCALELGASSCAGKLCELWAAEHNNGPQVSVCLYNTTSLAATFRVASNMRNTCVAKCGSIR